MKQKALIGEDVEIIQPPIGCDRQWLNAHQTEYLWGHCSKRLSWKRHSLRGTQLPRLNAAYTSKVGGILTYSGETVVPLPMDKVLRRITDRVSQYLGIGFNSIILNWYKEPRHHIGWHRDNILECGLDCPVASLSLGDSRVFQLRQGKSGQIFSYILGNGDLLLMAPGCQREWVHRVVAAKPSPGEPQTKGRISLTFREIQDQSVSTTVETVQRSPLAKHAHLAEDIRSQIPKFRHRQSGQTGELANMSGVQKIFSGGKLYAHDLGQWEAI